MTSFTVLVVDDYEPFRRLTCSVLEEMPGIQILGEASDGLEAIQKAEELRPDLILLDIGMPRLNGIQAARSIRESVPQSKIVFLSQETSPDVIEEAFRLGAFAYVAKVNAGTDLLKAVEAVRQGSSESLKQFVKVSR
jgi:DNA-binding NarL/FixJ family response regulator